MLKYPERCDKQGRLKPEYRHLQKKFVEDFRNYRANNPHLK